MCFPVVGFGKRIPTSSRERERRTRCIHPSSVDGRPAGTREDRDTHTERERERVQRVQRVQREREREWILIHTVRLCRRIASGIVASGGIRPRTRHTSSNMDGWMDAARFPRMDGWMDARKPTTTIGAFHPDRTRRFNDDLNAGNETNGNSRARCGGVRPPTRVASMRIAGVETVAEKALWMDGCRKKIYSRVQRLTSDATTKRSIERTQGDYREF